MPRCDVRPAGRISLYDAGCCGRVEHGKRIRIVFDGTTSYRPVISELVLACQAPVNIMFADTHDVGGVAYGHMIVELPSDERLQEKITAWLKTSGITYNEEA